MSGDPMMKVQFAATALCALMSLQPVWAQQSQQRSMTPSRAEPNPTSNPPANPHKDGGRPESHDGTVHAPQLGGAQSGSTSLSPEMRQAAEALARSAITAQQYGNLASKRHTSGAVHDLGDQMVLTNSRINRALSALSPELRASETMPAQERASFDNLARDADEVQFGISVAQWVAQTYPQAISALEQLGKTAELRNMAASAIPDLRTQLSSAQTILQSARATPNGQPASTGTIPDSKTKSD
jgi:hypothetical protein